jgi:hypothetical protein
MDANVVEAVVSTACLGARRGEHRNTQLRERIPSVLDSALLAKRSSRIPSQERAPCGPDVFIERPGLAEFL